MKKIDDFSHAVSGSDSGSEPSHGAKAQASELREEGSRQDEIAGQIVFGPIDRPFETPVTSIEAGPWYIDASEVHADLRSESDSSAPDAENSTSALGADPSNPNPSDDGVDRRDFMRLFSTAALLSLPAASCVRRPEEKALPYVNQPVDVVPGKPVYYASTCGECTAGCRVMVKTREGRPVKVEGDPLDAISQGALCSLGQSTLQSLYHPERRRQSMMRRGKRLDPVAWEEVFEHLARRLADKPRIGILTGGSTGHQGQFYRDFLAQVGSDPEHLYSYDSNGLLSALTKAHELAFGVKAIPRPDLRRARTIVGIGSDFLEHGVSPTFFAKSFAASHGFNSASGTKSIFIQFESYLSQTGAKADVRHLIPARSELLTLILLIKHLRSLVGEGLDAAIAAQADQILNDHSSSLEIAYDTLGLKTEDLQSVAEALAKSDGIILAGSTGLLDETATSLQLAAIVANQMIGAYGKTLFIDNAWLVAPVNPGDIQRFMNNAANLDALFIIDSNPAFTLPQSMGFAEALKKIPTVISIQSSNNETDAFAEFVLAGNHYLESWGDAQPAAGYWNMRQPAVRTMTDSRQAEDIMLWTLAYMKRPLPYTGYQDYLEKQWKKLHDIFGQGNSFNLFVKAVLRRGGIGRPETQAIGPMNAIADKIKASFPKDEYVLLTPFHPHLRDGIGATRPILQEAPHGLTTIVWDSYLIINPQKARELGLRRDDVVRLETSTQNKIDVAIYPLPGVHPSTLVFCRGNGRQNGISRVSDGFGLDPMALIPSGFDALSGEPMTSGVSVTLSKTGKRYRLAATQRMSDIGNRTDIVRKISLSDAAAKRDATKDLDDVPNLYPALKTGQHRWGMTIDLDKCTGCGACLVACSTENNVPQVGREQILLGREMYWIRIDRYFMGPVANPETVFQPMPCQHCNHAPCEAVCPVFATTHDVEGVNAMTYNRCVGTRYCANACPYKIRRFNWWTHKWNVIGERQVDRNPRALNPDVTVRTRGVMEKCNFCYQRIREAKHRTQANAAGKKVVFVQTACQQTCPSDAIIFGDLFVTGGDAAKARQDNRTFLALGGTPELHEYGLKTLPNVSYQAKIVQNITDALQAANQNSQQAPGQNAGPQGGAPGSDEEQAPAEAGGHEGHEGHEH